MISNLKIYIIIIQNIFVVSKISTGNTKEEDAIKQTFLIPTASCSISGLKTPWNITKFLEQ